MNKKEQVYAWQDQLTESMLDKDETRLRELLHPDVSVFGSAIHEHEKGIENVISYYLQSLALLPKDKRVDLKWRDFIDLGDQALVEQEFEIHFTIENNDVIRLTLRQSALWTLVPSGNTKEKRWLLLHDHSSLPDHLGAFETISTDELLEQNLNLEFEPDKLRTELVQTLSKLDRARKQLFQQEKLAAVGQLTAGIVHEIKNPLNFVNNFSELSVELIEEAREELRRLMDEGGPGSEKGKVKGEKTQLRESSNEQEDSPLAKGDAGEFSDSGQSADADMNSAPDHIHEILDDIKLNLKKIHEHSSRADSIVKSMLQHSRGGTGKMEPTDLNALIKEYVNLCFHGMRAGKDPLNVDIDLQLDESIDAVPLIAEDFSRVLVNLCNNAFDAMREKQGSGSKEQGSGRYEPKLTVRTKSDNGNVTVEIEDNGPGVPEEMKDKILQPFFTTKKGTEGTGLGLSITNDIVKAHRGELTIASKNGMGTKFTIKLNK